MLANTLLVVPVNYCIHHPFLIQRKCKIVTSGKAFKIHSCLNFFSDMLSLVNMSVPIIIKMQIFHFHQFIGAPLIPLHSTVKWWNRWMYSSREQCITALLYQNFDFKEPEMWAIAMSCGPCPSARIARRPRFGYIW